MEKMDRPAAFVLVHSAWVGGWLWDGVAAHLRGRGFGVTVVELPGHVPDDTTAPAFEEYAAEARTALQAVLADAQGAADVYVVGHALGGAVVRRCPTSA